LIDFVDVNIHSIAFPAPEEFDIFPGDTILSGSDGSTLTNRVTRETDSRDACPEE